MDYDIVVVGAGPAGSSTARHAAEAGLAVLVIEKKHDVGFPSPCAGYVSKQVARYFKVDKRCIQQEIKKMRTHLPGGGVQVADMQGWIVDRPLFDNDLGVQAKDAGAEFMTGTRVTGLVTEEGVVKGVTVKNERGAKTIKAQVVVGADGPMSNVAKWAGLPSHNASDMAFCPQYEMVDVDLDDPTITETYFGVDYAPGSYVWVYPTGGGSAKVGLGIRKAIAGKGPFDYLDHFISNHPAASEMFKGATTTASLLAPVPVGGPVEKTFTDNLLLVGDAAGFTDPISGAGILSGILSGKIGAKVAARAIGSRDTSDGILAEYEAQWKKVLLGRLMRSVGKRKIVDESYTSDEVLEGVIPSTWITYKEFWK